MIKVIDKEYRNIQEQVKKNKDDIQTLYSFVSDYFVAGSNVTIELINNNTQARISATLNTAIDDTLSTSSTNPVQNKVITDALGDANNQINSLDTRVGNNYQSIQLLQVVKQDKLTAGDNITIIDNEISARNDNTYPIPYYHSGLKVTHSSDNDNNKDIYIPYATDEQAGVVNSQYLRQLIEEVLPRLTTPRSGTKIETFDTSFDPNVAYPNTTWRKFKDGIYFSSGSVIEHRAEQLINIKGSIDDINARGSSTQSIIKSGAFYKTVKSNGNNIGCGTPRGDVVKTIVFDASEYSPVYVDNGKVRPETITQIVWVRVDGLSQEVMDVISPYLVEEQGE